MNITLTRNRLTAIVLLLGALLVWLIVGWVWPSDSKKINHLLDQLAEAAGKADADAVMATVAPEYADESFSRAELSGVVHTYFGAYGATSVSYLQRGSVNVTGNRAVMEVVVLAQSAGHGTQAYLAGRSSWRLSFRREGDKWGIVKIEPLAFEGRQINGWRDAMRQF